MLGLKLIHVSKMAPGIFLYIQFFHRSYCEQLKYNIDFVDVWNVFHLLNNVM